ncbi:MAG: anti-sigma factor [Streptosporangiaceae bacterium]
MAGLEMGTGQQHDDLAGWVLGALDPAESERFRRHLQSCQQCQDEAAAMAPTSRLLNFVAPQPRSRAASPASPEPPADLRARTLDRVMAAARKSSWRRRSAWLSSAVAAAAVVVGGSVAALSLGSSPAYAYVLQPQNGSSASGKATVTHTDGGWSVQMSATHLKPLPRGEYYECWYAARKSTVSHPAMISGGTFSVGSSGSTAVTMNMAGDPDDYPIMEVTVQAADNPAQVGLVVLTGVTQDTS